MVSSERKYQIRKLAGGFTETAFTVLNYLLKETDNIFIM